MVMCRLFGKDEDEVKVCKREGENEIVQGQEVRIVE